ncbi:hypothetical protein [Mesorhizobium sp. DCY119]|uniref:hypothetical protein n=2 Tax=Mesorhizobium sp. DCY119 TaxID=2108445 RepID=UPI001FE1F28F|nr:hypothetical protein [Mesorhizobium sp. DCY119]
MRISDGSSDGATSGAVGRPMPRRLIEEDEPRAYYSAQRLAARSRKQGDLAGYRHWAKVASEVARQSGVAEMDRAVLQRIVDEESATDRSRAG